MDKQLTGKKSKLKQSKENKQTLFEWQTLCRNTTINAGTNFDPIIIVFRGGKYWKFDNKPEAGKPFGNLVEGQVPAKLDYPGIYFPGGAGLQKPDKFLMVYKNKWSRWKPTSPGGPGDKPGDTSEPDDGTTPGEEGAEAPEGDDGTDPSKKGPKDKLKLKPKDKIKEGTPEGGEEGGEAPEGEEGADPSKKGPKKDKIKIKYKPKPDIDVNDDLIRDEEDSLDGPEGKDDDAGALIPIDETIGKFAKIIEDKVCYILIKTNRALWSGECIAVTEDEHNFPPYIVAAIRNGDDFWFFINKDGKYCKRKHNNVETVCKLLIPLIFESLFCFVLQLI